MGTHPGVVVYPLQGERDGGLQFAIVLATLTQNGFLKDESDAFYMPCDISCDPPQLTSV